MRQAPRCEGTVQEWVSSLRTSDWQVFVTLFPTPWNNIFFSCGNLLKQVSVVKAISSHGLQPICTVVFYLVITWEIKGLLKRKPRASQQYHNGHGTGYRCLRDWLSRPFPAYTAHKLGFGGSQASVAIDLLATADWFRFSFPEMWNHEFQKMRAMVAEWY